MTPRERFLTNLADVLVISGNTAAALTEAGIARIANYQTFDGKPIEPSELKAALELKEAAVRAAIQADMGDGK